MKEKICEIWDDLPYRKMPVVYGHDDMAALATGRSGIELKRMNEIINDLLRIIKSKPDSGTRL